MRWLLLFSVVLSVSSAHALQCREIFSSTPLAPTTKEVQEMLLLSRTEKMSGTLAKDHQDFFARILAQPEDSFSALTAKRAIEYLSLFAQWRLLPPKSWSDQLMLVVATQLPDWNSKNFLAFAQQRKISPLVLPSEFLLSYQKAIQEKITDLDSNTQLEVISAELYHGNPWNTEDLRLLIDAATVGLKNSEQLKIKPLKEMHRALLFLSGSDRSAIAESIQALSVELEKQMQGLGFSLHEGGRSYSQNAETGSSSFLQSSFAMDLLATFPGSNLRYDYESATKPGFFDPVDIFIKEQMLVVDWDGPQHYYRSLDDGDLVLRVSDQARDRVLRANGYRVLRISPPMWPTLDNADIPTLINQQNP